MEGSLNYFDNVTANNFIYIFQEKQELRWILPQFSDIPSPRMAVEWNDGLVAVTHWSQEMDISIRELGHHWFRLFDNKPLPESMLTYHQFGPSQWKCQENVVENVTWKMSTMLSSTQCANGINGLNRLPSYCPSQFPVQQVSLSQWNKSNGLALNTYTLIGKSQHTALN